MIKSTKIWRKMPKASKKKLIRLRSTGQRKRDIFRNLERSTIISTKKRLKREMKEENWQKIRPLMITESIKNRV